MGKRPIYIRLGHVCPPAGFKMCACCEDVKPHEEYRYCSESKDKMQSWCNECSDTYRRGYEAGKKFALKSLRG